MPEKGFLRKLREGLTKTTPLVSFALGLISVVLAVWSAISQIPFLELTPIALVLIFFFSLLALATLALLVLHYLDLGGAEERRRFVRTLVYGFFLFLVMISGMFARYFWELFQAGRELGDADLKRLLMPLLVSLMVFYPLWSIASGAQRNFFSIVAAFQNGFFWQTIFSRLGPITGSGSG